MQPPDTVVQHTPARGELVEPRAARPPVYRLRTSGMAFAFLLLLPSLAHAQASLAGIVRDESGGVLPGVTVEASSPALIEGARSVTTDDQGRYRIEALRPGLYTLTFTLAGFASFTRNGVEVPADTVVTINAEM